MRSCLLFFVFCLSACAPSQSPSSVLNQSAADIIFEEKMAQIWQYTVSQNPTWATQLGIRDYDDQLGDYSLQQYDREVAQSRLFQEQLKAIDVGSLNSENALNYKLLNLRLSDAIEAAKFGGKYQLLTNRSGPHLSLAQLPSRLPFRTTADYQSYLKRLALMPSASDQVIERLRLGMQAGWVQPCEPMRGYENSIDTHVVENVSDSNFMQPFAKRPDAISETEFATYKAEAEKLVGTKVIPAFASFANFYPPSYRRMTSTISV